MFRKIRMAAAVAVLLFSSLACNLAKLAQNAQATQTAQAAVNLTPGDTSSSATPIPASDLPTEVGEIHLTSADLPAGFTAISDDQMAQMGISAQELSSAITSILSGATTRNTDAFLNPSTNEVILCAIIAPLNALERTAFDLYLSDPSRVLGEIEAQAENTTASQNTSVSVGDASIAFESLTERPYLSLSGQGVLSRRGSVIQVTLQFYPQGVAPTISAAGVAATMDAKMQSAQ
jgi:hypothetical protein